MRLFVWADFQGPAIYLGVSLVWGSFIYRSLMKDFVKHGPLEYDDRVWGRGDIRFAAFVFGAFWFLTIPVLLISEVIYRRKIRKHEQQKLP